MVGVEVTNGLAYPKLCTTFTNTDTCINSAAKLFTDKSSQYIKKKEKEKKRGFPWKSLYPLPFFMLNFTFITVQAIVI